MLAVLQQLLELSITDTLGDSRLLGYEGVKRDKMKKVISGLVLLLCFSFACTNNPTTQPVERHELVLDSAAINSQLRQMVRRDQKIQMAHQFGESKEVSDSLYAVQEEIFRNNTDTIRQLFNDYGYLGFNKLGMEGSNNFWLLVQHADHDPTFQEAVLDGMDMEVRVGNADGKNYAYLTDRVLVNSGQKQLYGTQVSYKEDFWAIPRPLQDSANVDKRRSDVGLPPIRDYLNEMMEIQFQMNQEVLEKAGITKPLRYGLRDKLKD